jgi:hypothetical protein
MSTAQLAITAVVPEDAAITVGPWPALRGSCAHDLSRRDVAALGHRAAASQARVPMVPKHQILNEVTVPHSREIESHSNLFASRNTLPRGAIHLFDE